MKQKYNWLFYFAFLIGIILVGCTQQDCIQGVAVEYASKIPVHDENGVEKVFNQFIEQSIKYNKQIGWGSDANKCEFISDPNKCKFEKVASTRLFEGVKYWRVTSSLPNEYYQDCNHCETLQSYDVNLYSVSEKGEVVRLLGCT